MIWINCPTNSEYDWVYVFDGSLDDWRSATGLPEDISLEQTFREHGVPVSAGEPRRWCIENNVKRVPLLDGSWKPSRWQRAVPFRIVPQNDTKAVFTKLRWF